jgi:F-type H+-transporting ATPase subunit epsilon
MTQLQVELVSADRLVWSGEASMVIARTVDGDLGVLPNHSPVLALLGGGEITVRTEGEDVRAAVHGGFLSVADNRVSILAEAAELADEIDVARARRALDEARAAADNTAEDIGGLRAAETLRAETRLRVAGQPGL